MILKPLRLLGFGLAVFGNAKPMSATKEVMNDKIKSNNAVEFPTSPIASPYSRSEVIDISGQYSSDIDKNSWSDSSSLYPPVNGAYFIESDALDGSRIKIEPNQDLLEGTFDENEKLHGDNCQRRTADGVQYTGKFEHGRLIYGSIKDGNGNRVKGTFDKNEKLHGDNCQHGQLTTAVYEDRLQSNFVLYEGRYEHGKFISGTTSTPETDSLFWSKYSAFSKN